jgi:hypothetical protein
MCFDGSESSIQCRVEWLIQFLKKFQDVYNYDYTLQIDVSTPEKLLELKKTLKKIKIMGF